MEEQQLMNHERATSQKDEAFVARLKTVVEQYGSISSLARAANISESAIRKWRDGVSEPSRDRLIALSKAARVSFEWLATGEGSMYTHAQAGTGSSKQSNQLQALEESAIVSSSVKSERGLDVVSLDPRASFSLTEISETTLKQYVSVGCGSGRYWFYRINNESMEPTIDIGDLCIIAERKPELSNLDDGIYALLIDGIAAVRRIQKIPNNRIQVSTDNSKYGISDVINLSSPPKDFVIIGKVVYICQAVAVA